MVSSLELCGGLFPLVYGGIREVFLKILALCPTFLPPTHCLQFCASLPTEFLYVPSPIYVALNIKWNDQQNFVFQTKIKNEDVAAEDEMDDEDEDNAMEALFKQLEEDLENDDLSVDDDDDEISEEDMAMFEQELAEVIGDVGGADESTGDLFLGFGESGDDDKVDGSQQPELKSWQLRRLACALKIGRRKISVRS
jgi:hypothetical protein